MEEYESYESWLHESWLDMEEYKSYEVHVAEQIEPVAVIRGFVNGTCNYCGVSIASDSFWCHYCVMQNRDQPKVEYPKVTRIKTDGSSAIDKIHRGDSIEYVFYIGGELLARIPGNSFRQKHLVQWLESVTIFKMKGRRTWPGVTEEPVRNSIKVRDPEPVTRDTFEKNAGKGVYKYIPEMHVCKPPYPTPPSGSIWQCAEQKDDGSFCDQEWMRGSTQWNKQPKVSAANAGWDESVREMQTYKPNVPRTKEHKVALFAMSFTTAIILILIVSSIVTGDVHAMAIAGNIIVLFMQDRWRHGCVKARDAKITKDIADAKHRALTGR